MCGVECQGIVPKVDMDQIRKEAVVHCLFKQGSILEILAIAYTPSVAARNRPGNFKAHNHKCRHRSLVSRVLTNRHANE